MANQCRYCTLRQEKIKRLEVENQMLKQQIKQAAKQHYCKICGNTLNGYKPVS